MGSLSLHKSQGDVANMLRARCRNDLRDEQFYPINSLCAATEQFSIYRFEFFLVYETKNQSKRV